MTGEICQDCGKDHDEEYRESFPEYLMLKNAYEHVLTIDPEDMSRSIHVVSHNIAQENVMEALRLARSEGGSAIEAVVGIAAVLFKLGLAVGTATRDYYLGEFGTIPLPSDEEVEQEYEDAKKRREEAANSPSNALVEALRQAGIPIPDNVDAHIIQIDTSNFPKEALEKLGVKSASSEEKVSNSPGFYL